MTAGHSATPLPKRLGVTPGSSCWPKRASKVPTDMTEDVVREVVLALGLVDVKVAAIGGTWSGLRVVRRRENP